MRPARLSLAFALLMAFGAPSLFANTILSTDKRGVIKVGDTTWGTLHTDLQYKPSSQKNRFEPENTSGQEGPWFGPLLGPSGKKLFTLVPPARG